MSLDNRLVNLRQELEGSLRRTEYKIADLRSDLAHEEARATEIRADLAELDARFPEKVVV